MRLGGACFIDIIRKRGRRLSFSKSGQSTSHHLVRGMGRQLLPVGRAWARVAGRLGRETSDAVSTMGSAVCVLSHVHLFVSPWTAAHRVPLSMGFASQEY